MLRHERTDAGKGRRDICVLGSRSPGMSGVDGSGDDCNSDRCGRRGCRPKGVCMSSPGGGQDLWWSDFGVGEGLRVLSGFLARTAG